jgi:hypothetical protein
MLVTNPAPSIVKATSSECALLMWGFRAISPTTSQKEIGLSPARTRNREIQFPWYLNKNSLILSGGQRTFTAS